MLPIMGNNLRRLRVDAGLSEQEAADRFGLSLGGYRKIERGERKLSDRRIQKAQEIYEVSASEVLGSGVEQSEPDIAALRISRFELIRRAFTPDLPNQLRLSVADWQALVTGRKAVSADLMIKIHDVTRLPLNFIRRGFTDDLSIEAARALAGAAIGSVAVSSAGRLRESPPENLQPKPRPAGRRPRRPAAKK